MRLNVSGLPRQVVLDELAACHDRDHHFPDGRIMGSMCTSPDALAREAYMLFMEANLGNPGLCPGTAKLERRVLGMLTDLLGIPVDTPGHFRAGGQLVGGGTEANITALWIARNIHQSPHHTGTTGGFGDGPGSAAGDSGMVGRQEMIIPESGHFSLFKAADLLGLEPKVARLTPDYRMDQEHVKELLSPRTVMIVAVAGTTELGQVDPIRGIGEVAMDAGIPLHVDAAFGGFVLPFLENAPPDYDFRTPGVTSMGVDPHKMGLAPIPSGALLLRDGTLTEAIRVETPYLTSERNVSLAGTRNSASVAATYAVMRHLGREGYRRTVERCMDTTRYLWRRLGPMGIEPVIEPVMNVVAGKVSDPAAVVRWMRDRGWHLSVATHPPSVRFVIMPHLTRDHIDAMLHDLGEMMGYGKKQGRSTEVGIGVRK